MPFGAIIVCRNRFAVKCLDLDDRRCVLFSFLCAKYTAFHSIDHRSRKLQCRCVYGADFEESQRPGEGH